MSHCPACREELPDKAQFCGLRGVRLARPLRAATLKPEPSLDQAELDPAVADTVVVSGSAAPRAGHQDHGLGRREYRRLPLRVDVSCSSEHNVYTGRSENISGGGLFVATSTPVKIGDAIEVVFTVPGIDRACRARCEVAWAQSESLVLCKSVHILKKLFKPGKCDCCIAPCVL